jgi:alpha-ribazole phosphatase
MKKIYLVRHGETDWNRQMRFQGQRDIPLNENGKNQARLLSEYLSTKNFTAIFASPLSRAWETAKIIAGKHSLTPEAVEGLQEMHFGNWEGKIYKEMNETDRLVMEQWFSDPVSNHIPGGESLKQFQKRIQHHYDLLLDNHPAGNLVVITHGGAIKIIVAGILEIPLSKISRLRLLTASLTVILYDSWNNPYLELFNGTGHLQS